MSLVGSIGSGAAAGAAFGPWGAAAGAAIGAIGSVANSISGKKGAKEQRDWEAEQAQIQREWNERMLDKQNQFTVDMWNKTNEYNDPSSQLARMQAAGLNPLYYGLDGSSANGVESAQALGYERPSGGQSPITAGMQAGMDSAVKFAQLENLRSQTAKNNNENVTETQRRENMSAELDKLRAEVGFIGSQEGLTKEQAEGVRLSNAWIDRLNSANVGYMDSQSKLNDSQKKRIEELLEGEKLIQAKTLEDFDKKWAKIEQEIKNLSKEWDILDLDVQNYALNHAQNGAFGTGFSIPNLIRLRNQTPAKAITSQEGLSSEYENYRQYED